MAGLGLGWPGALGEESGELSGVAFRVATRVPPPTNHTDLPLDISQVSGWHERTPLPIHTYMGPIQTRNSTRDLGFLEAEDRFRSPKDRIVVEPARWPDKPHGTDA